MINTLIVFAVVVAFFGISLWAIWYSEEWK